MPTRAAQDSPVVATSRALRTVSDGACWQCGAEVPPRARWRAAVAGAERSFCCAGCLAVATTIAGAGLERYYATRQAAAVAPRDGVAPPVRWNAAAGSTRALADGGREASLLLDGLTCGACAWLVESWLARQPGVTHAAVNYATRRAEVAWREGATTLDAVVGAVATIGYRAHPYDPAKRESLARAERRALLVRTGIAWLAMMQVMMFAVPGYLSDDGIAPAHQRLLDWASLVMTVPVMLFSAWPILAGAWRDVARRRLGMDVPVALGLAAAFAASAWSTLVAGGPVYYDSITMFVALLLAARYVELAARHRAGDAVESAARAMPATAERYEAWPATPTCHVDATSLRAGDTVLVRPGGTVPADGTIVEGSALVEEALLTGESWPKARSAGERVLAGSITRDRAIVVRVTAAGDATTLAGVQRMVERAASARPRVARLADRAAGVFVATLVSLAAATAIAWLAVDPSRALPVTFALLVVSCPCALSLATPAAIAAASGALGRRGVLFPSPDGLEALARVTHVAFDKTGTLTLGTVRLSATLPCREASSARAIAIAAALEARSEHPIARALVAAHTGATVAAEGLAQTPGQGVEGYVDAGRYRLGRFDFVAGLSGAPPRDLVALANDAGRRAIVVALGDEHGFVAAFALGDELAAGAREAVARLKRLRVESLVLSGDRQETASAFAEAAGIATAHGDLAPEAKRDAIAALQRRGAVVAMVGDGVNDAPALAQAQASVTLAGATPIATWTSDVVIVAGGLDRLGDAIAHARRTLAVVRQNLAWATLYNAIAIPAAALGYVTPLVAAVGMSVSSLVVVVNAARLARVGDLRQQIAPRDAPAAARLAAAGS
ncbi:MAG TPA: heavy metal translocating P-type ATPase [Casimicrobiaceae bacterium]|nr:heavy metal translocating P-type ATPase [Casimicrobiaceae bacterium]